MKGRNKLVSKEVVAGKEEPSQREGPNSLEPDMGRTQGGRGTGQSGKGRGQSWWPATQEHHQGPGDTVALLPTVLLSEVSVACGLKTLHGKVPELNSS